MNGYGKMIYIDMLRKALKQDKQQETAQDLQFQQLLMTAGMQGQQNQAPQQGPQRGRQGPPNVNGSVISSQMQGFNRVGDPRQAPPGTPGGPGPRVNPMENR